MKRYLYYTNQEGMSEEKATLCLMTIRDMVYRRSPMLSEIKVLINNYLEWYAKTDFPGRVVTNQTIFVLNAKRICSKSKSTERKG